VSETRSDRRAVKQWWAQNPMTYTSTHGDRLYVTDDGREEALDLGTREFFNRVDATFYKWNLPLHADGIPFGRFFPYAKYRGARVLEVGCGMGTMAMNWARQGARVVASDLNPVAAAQTRRRLQLFDLPTRVLQTDGGSLPFRDSTFDYVYSWGVLHHSPKLDASIAELLRVLRSGGEYGVMLYNRQSVRQWYLVEYLEGLIHGESRFLSPLELASRYTDGAVEEGNPHTWPVTRREMIDLFSRYSKTVDVVIFGDKELRNTLKLLMPVIWRLVPDRVVRA
jgi:ubiquinone/menaquinone biosynthesis C-methylase UbiE